MLYIIESVDSISRDDPDVVIYMYYALPKWKYLKNGTLFKTFNLHHRVVRLTLF